MRKWIRRGLWAIAALALIVAVLTVANWARLQRVYSVVTLNYPNRIVANYSNMGSMFLTADVKRGGDVFAFGAAPAPLPESFTGPAGKWATADFLEETGTTSLLVIRDDRIEYEEYYQGTGPEDRRISFSVAKSFLSATLGLAIADGAIDSLDDPVDKYAPMLKGSAYEGATIRNVANMASGVAFDEDYLAFNSDINRMSRVIAFGRSLDKFTAGLKERTGPPGGEWIYVSMDTHVLGMVIRGALGRSIPDYMSEKLWSKIGPEADAYYLTDGDGVAFVLGGLNMRTRDYAKFGRLFLNDGVWEGEQVIPADWVRESTANNAPPPGPDGRRGQGYGYQWWLPPEADDEFYGIGIYGQYVFVDRKARVVIVKTSADRKFRDNDSRHQHETLALFRAIARP